MEKTSITVPVDAETARAYNSAKPEERRKMELLVSLWLRDLTSNKRESLQEVLDDISKRAQDRGLTPEILDSILRES